MKAIVTSFLLFASLFACAQLNRYERKMALTVNDHVPEIWFKKVLNYKSRVAKLSDFRGKLVILDFWSVNCSSCIRGFPKMDELQKKFQDKVQLLLVNPHDTKYDSEDKIKVVLQKLRERTGYYPSLPIPIHDDVLNIYFPHESVPHEVWIDGNGKVVAITNSYEVTEKNIEALLRGEKLNLPIKNDKTFDETKPLLVDGNGGEPGDFLFRSVFTKYHGELGFLDGYKADKDKGIVRIYRINKSMMSFIEDAYIDILIGLNSNRIIKNMKNSTILDREFNPGNRYCYDLFIPLSSFTVPNVKKYLQEDLSRYFNISVGKERRKMKCLIVSPTRKLDSIVSKTKSKEEDLRKISIKKYLHNLTVEEALHALDAFGMPMINETGSSNQKIDIDFPDNFDLSNQQAVIEFLKSIGFDIKEEERELDVVIITDKNPNNK